MAVTRGVGGVRRVEWPTSGVLLSLGSGLEGANGIHGKELRLTLGDELLPNSRAFSRCIFD